MKKQKLITGDAINTFTSEVNDLLSKGWRVVPGTLVMSLDSVARTYTTAVVRIETTTLYGVVLEEP